MSTIITVYPTGYPQDAVEHVSYSAPENAFQEALRELGIEVHSFKARHVKETLAGWDGEIISADVRIVN